LLLKLKRNTGCRCCVSPWLAGYCRPDGAFVIQYEGSFWSCLFLVIGHNRLITLLFFALMGALVGMMLAYYLQPTRQPTSSAPVHYAAWDIECGSSVYCKQARVKEAFTHNMRCLSKRDKAYLLCTYGWVVVDTTF
jgi:hypothetical protein